MPGKPKGQPNKKRMGALHRRPPAKRCPECGGSYYTPTCLICEAKAK